MNVHRYLRFLRPNPEADLDDELAFHLQARIDEFVAAGMTRADATVHAQRRFGSYARVRNECIDIDYQAIREATVKDMVQTAASDVRFALRQFGSTRALSIAAVLCFALGIGANTAIFSVVDALLFRPLPYREPGRLVIIGEEMPKIGGGNFGTISAPDFLDFSALNGRLFESSAIVDNSGYIVSGAEGPERVTGAVVSSAMLRTLGVRPILGRDFLPADDSVGAPDVVLLSSALWTRRFNREAGVVGKTLTLNGRVTTIIGVTPDNFAFPPNGLGATPAELFTPYQLTADELKLRGNVFNTTLVARLAPGVTVARATREANAVANGIPRNHPEAFRSADVQINAAALPLHDRIVGGVKRSLVLLLSAVALVLLIACINVSSLLLARAAVRSRELAVRTAIGATRGRLIQQFLAESVVLVAAGLTLGLAIAKWGTKGIVAIAPPSLVEGYDVGLDGRVLGVSIVIAVITALVFSVVPALRGSDRSLASELHDESRGSSAGRARQRGRRALVVSQIALALMVSAGAGLMLKSFVRARNIDPGFDPRHVLSFRLIAPTYRYAEARRVQPLQRQVIERLSQLPGVVSVSAASHLPMVGGWHIAFTPEGTTLDQTPLGTNNIVFPGFFETLRIGVVDGRPFSEQDALGAPPVAMINETLAKQYWPNESAVGKRIKWGSLGSPNEWKTIIGVVRDVKEKSLDEQTEPGMYLPMSQQDSNLVNGALRNIAVVVRTRDEPMRLSNAVRRAVREVDAELPVANLTDAASAAFSTVANRRFGVLLLAAFAVLGLLLAAVGIYGQMAYSVVQRRREMGVRLAIGATPAGVLRLVVEQGLRMAAIGVAIGVTGALALAQLLQKLLFGVSPLDVGTFAVAVVVLLLVCVLATWLPAWRASRVDPAIAMRAD